MKVLVTGGTGFLGSHVAARLRQLGHSVSILGRNEKFGRELESQGLKFHKVDISDDAAVLRASEEQECIVHCAGLAAAHGKYDIFYRANVIGAKNVVQACKNHKVKHLVNISSPGVYFNYQDRLNIKESDPLPEKQATHYAATKLLADEIVDQAVAEGLSAVSLRPRAIFGPGDNINLPGLLELETRGFFPLVGGGRSYIDMTYIDNVVDAVILAMEPNPALNGEKFNVTNDEPMMIREMVQKLFRNLQKEIRFINLPFSLLFWVGAFLEFLYEKLPTDSKPPLTKYAIGLMGKSQTHDISKAKKLLGYLPKVSMDEGFRRFAQSSQGRQGPK